MSWGNGSKNSGLDPWKVLGISEDSDIASIKRAYRRLVRTCHPDLFPHDPVRSRRFFQITEAYKKISSLLLVNASVLEPDNEDDYDAVSFSMSGDGYSFLYIEVSMEDAFWGKRVSVALQGPEAKCPSCDGLGYKWHGERPLCPVCGGKGYKEYALKNAPIRIMCKTCSATGFSNQIKCRLCMGRGYIKREREVFIRLPRGIMPGTTLRIDTIDGLDINSTFIEVGIRLPDGWKFEGYDIVSKLRLDLWDALLGAKINIMTIDGPYLLRIPPGTNYGQVFIIEERGWIKRDGTRGDHKIEIELALPKTPPPPHVRAMLKRLREIWPVEAVEGRSGFMIEALPLPDSSMFLSQV